MDWSEKYRPQTIDQLVGSSQRKAAKSLLEGAVKQQVFLGGSSGLGKTTIATLYAHRLNPGVANPFTIRANCRKLGVDDIRKIMEDVFRSKPLYMPYAVVFLDEVDGLHDAAQQALLDIEFAPPWVVFILATRFDNNVRSDLKSRCTQYILKPPGRTETVKHLVKILDAEGWKDYQDEAIALQLKEIVDSDPGNLRNLIKRIQQFAESGFFAEEEDEDTGSARKMLQKMLLSGKVDISKALEFIPQLDDPVGFVIGLCRVAMKSKQPARFHILRVFGAGLPPTMPADVGLAHIIVRNYGD